MIEHLPLRNLFPKGVIETKMAVLKALDKSCTEHISYISLNIVLNIHGQSADGL